MMMSNPGFGTLTMIVKSFENRNVGSADECGLIIMYFRQQKAVASSPV